MPSDPSGATAERTSPLEGKRNLDVVTRVTLRSPAHPLHPSRTLQGRSPSEITHESDDPRSRSPEGSGARVESSAAREGCPSDLGERAARPVLAPEEKDALEPTLATLGAAPGECRLVRCVRPGASIARNSATGPGISTHRAMCGRSTYPRINKYCYCEEFKCAPADP